MTQENLNGELETRQALLEGLYICAERSDPTALKILGNLYSTGLCVEIIDNQTSFQYYLEAAELGDAQAQFSVGMMYLKPNSKVEDGNILKSLSTPSFEIDQETGALVYVTEKSKRKRERSKEETNFVPRGIQKAKSQKLMENKRKAVGWFEKSAQNGDPKAQLILAAFYLDGSGGVEVNIIKAKELLEKSASQNNVEAIFNLGSIYFNGLKGKIDGEPVEIPENKERAIWLFHQAASFGDTVSQYWLGTVYHQGEYLPKDIDIALKYLNLAIQGGNAGAMYYLALMYKNGDGIQENQDEWKRLFIQSVEKGHGPSLYLVADMYYHGKEGFPQDYGMAFENYQKSAQSGNNEALYCLGTMHFHGKGTKQDMKAAFECYQQSATLGNKGSMIAMADMLSKGMGCEKDLKQAEELLKIVKDLEK